MAQASLRLRDAAPAVARQLRQRDVETVILAYASIDGAARPLPATLGEATGLLERNALACDWLGRDVVEHCAAMRRGGLAAQAAAVTDRETSRYLEAL